MALNIHTSHRLILGLSAGIYAALVLAIAVVPALSQEAGPPRVDRGREIYVRENCVVCHTQQIRGDESRTTKLPDGSVVVEVLRPDRHFGLDEASRAEDYASDDPALLGTQRTGPDLSTVGTRLPSSQWHFWHLYNPRAVSPDSVMPALPWLFSQEPVDGGEEVEVIPALGVEGPLYATPDAVALVEYLLSLQRRPTGR